MSAIQSSMAIEKEVDAVHVSDAGSRAAASELSLADLAVGTRARVIAVKGSDATARRLIEMGVVPGAPVRIIKTAPLGDPLEVRIRSYHLALRRTEAQTISVVISDE
jgi:ferrous iron transport protein A